MIFSVIVPIEEGGPPPTKVSLSEKSMDVGQLLSSTNLDSGF